MPCNVVRWHCSVSGNLGGFLTSYILPHPFTGGFRRQYQRPAVMNIDQPLIGRSGHNQKSLCFISALERDATNSRQEDGLAVFTVNEVRLFLVAFLFPFKPAVCKTNCSPVLP
ncbi:Uncharacterised protein [Klebsiella pneumoniae]|nr:Uncharacterised protein [Klebsiella pneumoniae]SVP30961.1 Uncharacterised protein [Klebsiella pneumoniae]VGI68587.1 Uncharacterised protein [Klebsiella pneumoniae]